MDEVAATQTPNPTPSAEGTPGFDSTRKAESLGFVEAIAHLRQSRAARTSQEAPTPPDNTGASPEVAPASSSPPGIDEAGETAPEKIPETKTQDDSDPIVFTDEDGTTYRRSDVKKGILRQADYTKKTQELAAERKVLEEFKVRRDEMIQLLTETQEREAKAAPKEPDPVLRFTDPQKYAVQVADHLLYQENQRKRAAALEALQQEKLEEAVKEHDSRLRQEAQIMFESIPALKNAATPEERRAVMEKYKATARSVGFTDEDLRGFTDHRLMKLLDLATRGSAVAAGAARGREVQAATRTTTPSPTIKGASGISTAPSGADAVKAAQAKFEKTHSMDDARALMRARRAARSA